MKRPAVFLDRDGTIIEERDYLDRLDQLKVFPWTSDALRLLKRAGYAVVVVTNQSGIGRGYFDEAFVHDVHRAIDARLASSGGVDRYYFCPHHPDAAIERYRLACRCRKPGPAMIEDACRDLDLDPVTSVMVGDKWLDIGCARAAGTRALLVLTGHGSTVADSPPNGLRADAILNNLMEAVGWILRSSSRS